jgi:hypothetical protein
MRSGCQHLIARRHAVSFQLVLRRVLEIVGVASRPKSVRALAPCVAAVLLTLQARAFVYCTLRAA